MIKLETLIKEGISARSLPKELQNAIKRYGIWDKSPSLNDAISYIDTIVSTSFDHIHGSKHLNTLNEKEIRAVIYWIDSNIQSKKDLIIGIGRVIDPRQYALMHGILEPSDCQ